MAKKIKIGKKNSPDLTKSLKKYIKAENAREAETRKTYYRQFYQNEWDDDYYDDDFGFHFGSSRPWWADYGVESSLEEDEENYLGHNDDDFDPEYYKAHMNDLKQIYYYEDINDKWGRHEFHTIKEFNDFCAEMGILMTDETANNLIYNFETHCCLNPEDLEEGNLVLVDDASYGGLTWTVGMNEEEFEEVAKKSSKKLHL